MNPQISLKTDPKLQKQVILIVDDERTNLNILNEVLQPYYFTMTAKSGEQALQRLQSSHLPDLILLDIMMPGMDGITVCERINQDLKTREIPVIFVTAKTSIDDELRGFECGAVDFIHKPINPRIVLARVTSHLLLKEKQKELDGVNKQLVMNIDRLSASEERFRRLVQTVPDIVYKIDDKGYFTFLNHAIKQLGYDEAELLGKHFSVLMEAHEIDNVSREKAIAKYQGMTPTVQPKVFDERRTGNRITTGLQLCLKTKSGRHLEPAEVHNLSVNFVFVEINSSGLYGDDQQDQEKKQTRNYIGTVGIIRDITERAVFQKKLKDARDAADRANQAKSEFLANMSHEIRTPMNAVLGMTDIVLETELDSFQRKHLTTVSSSAHALLGILNQILDIAKLEDGRIELEEIVFEIRQIVEEAIAIWRGIALEKGIATDVDIATDVAKCVIGDPLRLRQIITNLVGNAVKFTNTGKVMVTISPSAKASGNLLFVVADTGIGIPSNRVDHIFDSFFQADSTTTRKYGGSGLGATISKQLVELMGGQIWVESELQIGSSFYFDVPLPIAEGVSDSQLSMHAQHQVHRATRALAVLLAEDVAANVELAVLRLERAGHSVTVAHNGCEAIEAFPRAQFDVVLMDINMPEMDGFEATQAIRKLEADTHGSIPVIALTASAMVSDREKCMNAGMDGFATKPIDFQQLFGEIARLLPDAFVLARESVPHTRSTAANVDDMTGFEGIDIRAAIANWGNTQRFFDILRTFPRNFSETANETRRFLAAGDTESARQICHKLKGTAGNLRITEVADIATTLESALKQKNGKYESLIALLENALAVATTSILSLPNNNESITVLAPLTRDLEKEKQIIHELGIYLTEGESDKVEATLQSLETMLGTNQLKQLKQQIEVFDYHKAVETLATISVALADIGDNKND